MSRNYYTSPNVRIAPAWLTWKYCAWWLTCETYVWIHKCFRCHKWETCIPGVSACLESVWRCVSIQPRAGSHVGFPGSIQYIRFLSSSHFFFFFFNPQNLSLNRNLSILFLFRILFSPITDVWTAHSQIILNLQYSHLGTVWIIMCTSASHLLSSWAAQKWNCAVEIIVVAPGKQTHEQNSNLQHRKYVSESVVLWEKHVNIIGKLIGLCTRLIRKLSEQHHS